MKKYRLLWIVCGLLVLAGCTDNADNPARKIELKNFSNTGCKSYTRAGSTNNTDGSYFELTAIGDNMLYVKHVNAMFNCASDKFEVNVEADGNSITITEYDKLNPEYAMACMCAFDLGYEIGPLDEGKTYTIKIFTGSAPQDPNMIPANEEVVFEIVYTSGLSKTIVPSQDTTDESLYGEWRLVGWTEGGTWLEIDTNYVSHQHMSIEIKDKEEGYTMAYSMVNEIFVGLLTLNGNEMIFGGDMRRGSTKVLGDLKENLFFEDHICDINFYQLEGKQLKLYYTDDDYFVFTKDFDDSQIQPYAWKNGVPDPYVAEVTAISDGIVDVNLLQTPSYTVFFSRNRRPEGVCHFDASDLPSLSFDVGDKIAFRIVQYKRMEGKWEFQLKVESCKGSKHVTSQAGMMHYDNRMGWIIVDEDRGAQSGASYFYPMRVLNETYQKEGLSVVFAGELYSTWRPPQIVLGGSDFYYVDIDAIELGPQGEEVPIDEAHFPDAAFRKKLIETYDWAADGLLTEAERRWVRTIDISDRGIKTLKGIEYFPNLIDLRLSGKNIEDVDVSKNTELLILMIDNCNLSSIDLKNNTKLTMLSLKRNRLKSIDLSRNTELGEFYLERNLLTSLDLTGLNRLAYISCFNNQIKGEAMDALIASLSSERSPQSFYGINTGDPDEGNVITKSQVSALQAKGWKVWDKSQGSSNLQQYPGSDE